LNPYYIEDRILNGIFCGFVGPQSSWTFTRLSHKRHVSDKGEESRQILQSPETKCLDFFNRNFETYGKSLLLVASGLEQVGEENIYTSAKLLKEDYFLPRKSIQSTIQ
jgi:hypothetical protein